MLMMGIVESITLFQLFHSLTVYGNLLWINAGDVNKIICTAEAYYLGKIDKFKEINILIVQVH